MKQQLTQKTCTPCQKGDPPLKGDVLSELATQLSSDWCIIDEHHLEKSYKFDDFKQALTFTNRVGEVAEDEGHHPDIFLTWGNVTLKMWTHNVGGLTENDFIFAAKADAAYPLCPA